MEPAGRPDRKRVALTALVVGLVMLVCLALALLPAVQEAVRDGLILPLIYAVWLVGLALRAIDQAVLWALGLGLLCLLMLWGLALAWTDRRQQPRSRSFDEMYPAARSGRVMYWSQRILSLRSQGLGSHFATQDFRRLARGVDQITGISQQSAEDQPPQTIQPFFEDNLAAYVNGLDDGDGAPVHSRAGWPARFWHRLQMRWLRWRKRPPPETEQAMFELCAYLEKQLEIDDEHGD